MSRYDLTASIERLEAYEDNAGIRFEGLSAIAEPSYGDAVANGWDISIRGEVHAAEGEQLPHSIEVKAAVYDTKGRVVDTLHVQIDETEFFVLEPFSLAKSGVPMRTFSRVLVYAVSLP
jgi:hypothetical protein